MSAVLTDSVPPVRERRTSGSKVLGEIFAGYLPMIIATLAVVVPLIWMIISSFKSPGEIVTRDLIIFPSDPSLAAYERASQTVDFPRLFLNSFIVTSIGSALKVGLALTTAYALVFVRFPFKRVIFVAILVALMVPPQVSLLPNYVFIAGLGGTDTYWGLILPGLGTAFGTFLLRQQFMALPKELLEAAEIDGAGHFRRLFSIVAPVSAPTIATVALVTIVTEWNEYIWPLVITNSLSMATLPVGLTRLQNSEPDPSAYAMLMAGSVLVILPVLAVFALLQRYIVAGLTQGAVK